jgi:CIC family chloride channel protein
VGSNTSAAAVDPEASSAAAILRGSQGAWLRGSPLGLLSIAIMVGIAAGLRAVVFRYPIYSFAWSAAGASASW